MSIIFAKKTLKSISHGEYIDSPFKRGNGWWVPKSYDVMEEVPWIDECNITAANTEYDQKRSLFTILSPKNPNFKNDVKKIRKISNTFWKSMEKKRDYEEWIFSGFFVMKTDYITRLKWKPLKNKANNLKSYKKLF